MLEKTLDAIAALDETAMTAAQAHQDRLALPPASLGRLHEFAVKWRESPVGQGRPSTIWRSLPWLEITAWRPRVSANFPRR